MQKIITLILLLFSSLTLAETCPDVKTIQSKSLTGWKVYDSDDHKPLSPARATAFKKSIEQFTLAEWIEKGKKDSAIRCYYSDKNGSGLEAYLSKNSYQPHNLKNYWYQVSGSMHCAAGMSECLFLRNDVVKQPQLARR